MSYHVNTIRLSVRLSCPQNLSVKFTPLCLQSDVGLRIGKINIEKWAMPVACYSLHASKYSVSALHKYSA